MDDTTAATLGDTATTTDDTATATTTDTSGTLLEEELLVEEISIDGMCGVY